MHSMSAKNAKYGFGHLIDLARSQPVTVEKHGRPVVVVLAVEEYARLCDTIKKAGARPRRPAAKRQGTIT